MKTIKNEVLHERAKMRIAARAWRGTTLFEPRFSECFLGAWNLGFGYFFLQPSTGCHSLPQPSPPGGAFFPDTHACKIKQPHVASRARAFFIFSSIEPCKAP